MGSKRTKSDNLQVSKITEKVESTVIDFDTWFYKKMKECKFRAFQRDEVKVFLTEQGLKYLELEEVFEDKIKSF